MTCEFAYADKLLCKTMIVVISFFVRGLCTSTIRNAGFVNNKNNNSSDTIYYVRHIVHCMFRRNRCRLHPDVVVIACALDLIKQKVSKKTICTAIVCF